MPELQCVWGGGGQILPTLYYWYPQLFSPSGITEVDCELFTICSKYKRLISSHDKTISSSFSSFSFVLFFPFSSFGFNFKHNVLLSSQCSTFKTERPSTCCRLNIFGGFIFSFKITNPCLFSMSFKSPIDRGNFFLMMSRDEEKCIQLSRNQNCKDPTLFPCLVDINS